MRPPLLLLAAALVCPGADRFQIAADPNLEAPARYGLAKLTAELRPHGESDVVIYAGLSSGAKAAGALRSAKIALPSDPQSLVIRRLQIRGKPALILCGADARGLMYATLDTADRIRWTAGSGDPLRFVRDTEESPYIAERGMSMYTMQRAYFESRLFDERNWVRYFDLLARSRINSFTVIFGYENGGFMAPPYPYFFDVPSHPGVKLAGGSVAAQQRAVNAFRSMIRIAHERGISVTAGIWDHIYRGGVQGGGIPGASEQAGKEAPGLVTGLNAENLASYTKSALQKFMHVFPEIDGLEFRMHTESGLKREEMGPFWHDLFSILHEAKPDIRVTLRAKDVPDSIIEDAIAQKLNIRMETKYWMEQMGLPFHPTHVNRQNQHDRRHGYADLLRYPQQYRVHWRLWSGGTTRLLLWADPEYVRRYAESARLYDGKSIDVNEMLATKMLGEPHEKPPLPILKPAFRFYDYEFERYWPFYQVWGRVSYNPSTPSEVWEREFELRFGKPGPELAAGLHLASRVLPRIVAAAYRYALFPTTRGWAEMMSQGDLPTFAALEGSDIEQFMNPKDAARSLLDGTDTSRRRPEETAAWFANLSAAISKHADRAESSAAALNAEGRSIVADLRILAGLARFYAMRLPAAVSYNLFLQTKSQAALDAAIEHERRAIDAWERMTEAAAPVYEDDLAFGVHAVGFPRHWREELARLRQGLEKLGARSGQTEQSPATFVRRIPGPLATKVTLQPAGKARAGQDLRVTVRADDPARIRSLRLRYRHLTQTEDYETAAMSLDTATGLYSARIPGAFISAKYDVMYFVEAIDTQGNGRNYPDLETAAPYVVVQVVR